MLEQRKTRGGGDNVIGECWDYETSVVSGAGRLRGVLGRGFDVRGLVQKAIEDGGFCEVDGEAHPKLCLFVVVGILDACPRRAQRYIEQSGGSP